MKILHFIPNNAAAVADFGGRPGIELILTGGIFRHQSNCLIGDFAINTVNMVIASKIIMGVDGMNFKEGLTSPIYQEAGITKAMIDRTQGQVICVADYTKIGQVTNFVTAPLSVVDILVTDKLFNENLRSRMEELGIKIIKSEEGL
jgi:DeoR/GlpR family transcriptional regulator of sugar metabolism